MSKSSSEIWLPVIGWEGLYEVSDLGRVRSLPRNTTSGKVLKPRPTHDGYHRVNLCRDGVHFDRYIATLVAEVFLGPCPPGKEILHGPAGKADNSVANLSYDDHIRNCEDRARDKPGCGRWKLTRADAEEIRARVAAGETQKSVAADYEVGYSTVNRIVKGQRWAVTAGGA